MELGLTGKVAIVTGGSDGIVKAAAISLCSEGAKVAIVGRSQDKLDSAVVEIKSLTSGEVIGISADVSVESQVVSMVENVVSQLGRLDILVNNAGTSSATTLEEMTDNDLEVDFGIKIYGAIYCARAALPYLKTSGHGVILNTTTPGGKAAPPARNRRGWAGGGGFVVQNAGRGH